MSTIVLQFKKRFRYGEHPVKAIIRGSFCSNVVSKHANHMTMTTSWQIMPWSDCLKTKRENKVARHVWDFDCLHFAQYILISPHGIDCKQTWCKKIYDMNRVSWLKPLVSLKHDVCPTVCPRGVLCELCSTLDSGTLLLWLFT